jgi:hypothetical protein
MVPPAQQNWTFQVVNVTGQLWLGLVVRAPTLLDDKRPLLTLYASLQSAELQMAAVQ